EEPMRAAGEGGQSGSGQRDSGGAGAAADRGPRMDGSALRSRPSARAADVFYASYAGDELRGQVAQEMTVTNKVFADGTTDASNAYYATTFVQLVDASALPLTYVVSQSGQSDARPLTAAIGLRTFASSGRHVAVFSVSGPSSGVFPDGTACA